MSTEGLTLGTSGTPLPDPVTRGIPRGAERIALLAALLVLAACVGTGLTMGSAAAVGAASGGVLALVNFWLLSRFVVSVTAGDDVHWSALLARLMFKLALLGVCLYVMLMPLALDFLGVIIGLSVVVVASTFAQALGLVN